MKNWKSIAVFSLILVFALSFTALAWNDGVYVGKADGHNGPLSLEVTVAGGKITAIKVLEHKETPNISDAGFKVADTITANQSLKVDTVSGATVTSKAVIAAVKNALTGAWSDGKYTGEAKGHNGQITVEVEVVAGKIANITILSHNETPMLSDEAFNKVPAAIISTQSTQVDTVSGATVTSKAVMAAVNDALYK